ncbi:Calreticulin-2 [Zea mays]|uniref:Calreticulin-2 n=1 Tax=Zea mays TaxID=4577 RepID=A0A1D6LF50_MAIZE|nr:Calreticulin-2 [Zea mays]
MGVPHHPTGNLNRITHMKSSIEFYCTVVMAMWLGKSFSMKHEQKLDHGGDYVKLHYICGYITKKVHTILTKDGKNHLIKKDVPCETDQLTHVYTLIICPDATYFSLIMKRCKMTTSMSTGIFSPPPKQIKDPEAKKGYDDIPKEIRDPDANKPEDWDNEGDDFKDDPYIYAFDSLKYIGIEMWQIGVG